MVERHSTGRENPISRVKCVVNSCQYHDENNHCIASAIEIQPPHASGIEETDCATFRRKK